MAETAAALARAVGLLLPLGRPAGPEGGALLVLLDLGGRGLVVVEGLAPVRGLERALSLVGPAGYTVPRSHVRGCVMESTTCGALLGYPHRPAAGAPLSIT